ncbi:2-succinyl-5-enolpyruvyl-6-hydroxy-3-cyclohexene-1-carboxylic-acid synthase [Schaalia suimastitidis]|uniref:2-succinyl-5-enolpyruvyl-6-hydroxy-3- cyclohexene-1-carboxylic-acid synthase n=1 Tax=Schaalia suimastitidis TaxID=121163 RepID=UPI0004095967|nr:2-succinyl-5-enolpyruvyl-6-hydroxy-3-cyclohexene-1-carboxylic-acid synthase [Schaalia suimastitidis]
MTHPESTGHSGVRGWPHSCLSAAALLSALIACGVTDVVYCPGSRSAPFAYALDVLSRAGALRTHVRLDERSAAFLAVGLSRGGAASLRTPGNVVAGVPIAIVTTSGTAVAELHAGIAEASHAYLPIIVLSADRPFEMRGVGASQTTDQAGIFASHVRHYWDIPAGSDIGQFPSLMARACATALGKVSSTPGPVHLNVGMREPLQPDPESSAEALLSFIADIPGAVPELYSRSPHLWAWESVVDTKARTVVLAGDGADAAAVNWANKAGIPLLSEVGALPQGALAHPQSLLSRPELVSDIEQVVLTGRPTLSRIVQRLLASQVRLVVHSPHLPWPDVAGKADAVVTALAAPTAAHADDTWLPRWRQAAQEEHARIEALLDTPRGCGSALAVARSVWRAADRYLVVGASNAVRALDLVGQGAGPSRVIMNRGLAGIDGTVATAIGAALATGTPTRAVMGDLTFFHDAGALAIPSDEVRPNLQIIVVDDHGGSIFGTLEHGRAPRPVFDRWFRTAQSTSVEALCAAYQVAYRKVTPGSLVSVFDEAITGLSVVHVPVVDDPEFYATIRGLDSQLTFRSAPANGQY